MDLLEQECAPCPVLTFGVNATTCLPCPAGAVVRSARFHPHWRNVLHIPLRLTRRATRAKLASTAAFARIKRAALSGVTAAYIRPTICVRVCSAGHAARCADCVGTLSGSCKRLSWSVSFTLNRSILLPAIGSFWTAQVGAWLQRCFLAVACASRLPYLPAITLSAACGRAESFCPSQSWWSPASGVVACPNKDACISNGTFACARGFEGPFCGEH